MKKIKYIYFLIIVLFLFIIDPSSVVQATDEETVVIRVGYTGSSGMLNTPIVTGSEGYGYEYLHKLLDYTEQDYEVEFVFCEWAEGFELLESGEIDLFGPTTYTEDKATDFLYMADDVGNNTFLLVALDEEDALGTDYAMLDGTKVGVQAGYSSVEPLMGFLEEYDLEVELVEIYSSDIATEMTANGCTYYFTSSMKFDPSYEVVLSFGAQEVFFIANQGNVALIEDLDQAMEQLNKGEYLYEEQLLMKYFDYDISTSAYISVEEYDLLQSQEVYQVGVMNLYGALSSENSSGELEGVAIDVVEMVAEKAGINIEYVELTMNSTPEEYENLDFYFLEMDSSVDIETLDSDTYYEIPLLMIERAHKNESEIESVGTVGYYGFDDTVLSEYISDRTLTYYFDIHELKEAYNNGDIDSMIITSASLNMIREDIDDKDFYSSPIDLNVNLSLTFPLNYSEEKIDVFNKIIYKLDDAEIAYSLLQHSSVEKSDITIRDVIEDNPLIIGVILFLVIAIIMEVNHRKRKELDKVVNIDPLTGFYTQHKFVSEVQKILAANQNKNYSILTFDIDNFKYINEIYGYETGTDVLRRLANYIKPASMSAIVIARAFGDNFICLYKSEELTAGINLDMLKDESVIQELNENLGDNYSFSFSIGCYEIKDRKLDINYMIDCANLARGLGKKTVGTTFYKFTESMKRERVINNEIVATMSKSIEDREFVLYYQPKIDLRTRGLSGAETLVRWLHNGKIVSPDKFIPVFEKNGFIIQLDYYVFEETCRFIQKYRAAGVPKISVNLSGITIQREGLTDKLVGIAKKYDVDPREIDIEITETAFIERHDVAVNRIKNLRKVGFTISMDDFGAGISSLNRLKNIELDTIKIDREFIVNSLENAKGIHIIKHIISMAKDIDVEIVAEGIETKAQGEFLLDSGCDVGQGYFFSRPLPEEDFVRAFLKNLD